MKKIILLSFLLVILISCKKTEFPTNPDWLNAKISVMESDPEYFMTTIYAYEWHKEYYYHISIPISSCGFCEFYNYDGDKYTMTAETYADFQKNAKKLQLVWEKDN